MEHQIIKERKDISFEVLKKYFGKKIDDVAKELGVSRSTFQRIKNKHGIKRWPSNGKNKNPEKLPPNKRVQVSETVSSVSSSNGIKGWSSNGKNKKNPEKSPPNKGVRVSQTVSSVSSCSTHSSFEIEENSSPKTNPSLEENASPKTHAIILAIFGAGKVVFRFDQPWTIKKLAEIVSQKFVLQNGSFKMRYQYPEGRMIQFQPPKELQIGSSKMEYQYPEGRMVLLPKEDAFNADDDLDVSIEMFTLLDKMPNRILVELI